VEEYQVKINEEIIAPTNSALNLTD